MNWDGRRYGLPNFGFKKVALGLCLTFYGPLMVTLGAILILALKYVPLQLKAINEYLRFLKNQKCGYLPFWLSGFPLLVGKLVTVFIR